MKQIVLDQLLFAAIQQKDVVQLEQWLKRGANPDAKLKWGHQLNYEDITPLYMILSDILSGDYGVGDLDDYKDMLTLLLKHGATLCFKGTKIDVFPFIGSDFEYFYECVLDKEMELDVVELFDFLISSFLFYGFDPNWKSKDSNESYIENIVEGYKSFYGDESIEIYEKILKDLLRYGSDCPCDEIVEENKEYANNIAKIFIEWPQLMLLYCLEKKNQFIYL